MLFVRQPRVSYCILEALAPIMTRLVVCLEELGTCTCRATWRRKMGNNRIERNIQLVSDATLEAFRYCFRLDLSVT